jgi:drug/metabolite transporter (DMT)-like permease
MGRGDLVMKTSVLPSCSTAVASRHARRTGAAFALAFAVVWSLIEVFVTRLDQRYELVQIEGVRFGVHLLLMLAVWGGAKRASLWRTRRPAAQILRGLCMLGLPFGFLASLTSGASIPVALTGLWLAPVFALALAGLFLRDRAPWGLWVCAMAGLGAVVCLLAPQYPVSWSLLAMPVLTGLAFALYLTFTRSLRDEPVQTNLFYVGLVGFVTLLPFMPGVWVSPGIGDTVLLVGAGAFGYLALWLLERSLRCWSLSHIAPLIYMHVVVLQLLSSVLHGRVPSLRLMLGGAIIGLVVLYVWSRTSEPRPARGDDPRFNSTLAPLEEGSA